jgi:hypothetical protein
LSLAEVPGRIYRDPVGGLAALEEGKTLWREVNSRLVVEWPGACFNETPFARVTQIMSDDVEGAAKILGFGLAEDKAIAGHISPLYQFKHFPDQPGIEVHWRAPFSL